MANDLIQQKKTKRNLMLMSAVGVVAIVLVAYLLGFFEGTKETPLSAEPTIQRPEIKVNVEILNSQLVKDLVSFSAIEPLPEEEVVGRENPFLPY